MVRTQIQLTEEQSAKIKALAEAGHISAAEVIRRAVDAVLRQSPGVGRDDRIERAIRAAGRFHSGHRDVSDRHDKHLAEAFRE